VHLRGATFNINMLLQLGGSAIKSGVLRVPGMTASDTLPLVAGVDIAYAAAAALQDFDAYANQVGSLGLHGFGLFVLRMLMPGCTALLYARRKYLVKSRFDAFNTKTASIGRSFAHSSMHVHVYIFN